MNSQNTKTVYHGSCNPVHHRVNGEWNIKSAASTSNSVRSVDRRIVSVATENSIKR